MGAFINKGNEWFKRTLSSEYVDKSGLIAIVNETLNTRNSYSCVTRCRRFGKSMAAEMLCAYYDKSCDSRELFSNLNIASDPSFEVHLNKYPVIYLDITKFTTLYKDVTIIEHIDEDIRNDIHEAFPDVPMKEKDDLLELLLRINRSEERDGERRARRLLERCNQLARPIEAVASRHSSLR